MRPRAPRPNRIGANPVAVKSHELAPRPGRLHNRGPQYIFPIPGGVYARGGRALPNYASEPFRAENRTL